ncbi:hypothetical protein BCR44DRAFT_40906, partial [Catenaria anguillulae PL171]
STSKLRSSGPSFWEEEEALDAQPSPRDVTAAPELPLPPHLKPANPLSPLRDVSPTNPPKSQRASSDPSLALWEDDPDSPTSPRERAVPIALNVPYSPRLQLKPVSPLAPVRISGLSPKPPKPRSSDPSLALWEDADSPTSPTNRASLPSLPLPPLKPQKAHLSPPLDTPKPTKKLSSSPSFWEEEEALDSPKYQLEKPALPMPPKDPELASQIAAEKSRPRPRWIIYLAMGLLSLAMTLTIVLVVWMRSAVVVDFVDLRRRNASQPLSALEDTPTINLNAISESAVAFTARISVYSPLGGKCRVSDLKVQVKSVGRTLLDMQVPPGTELLPYTANRLNLTVVANDPVMFDRLCPAMVVRTRVAVDITGRAYVRGGWRSLLPPLPVKSRLYDIPCPR